MRQSIKWRLAGLFLAALPIPLYSFDAPNRDLRTMACYLLAGIAFATAAILKEIEDIDRRPIDAKLKETV